MINKRTLDFYLGPWLIQPQQHRIRGEEGAVRIEPKIMDVLLCLVDFPGETVTRDYLLETVWEGTIVTDDVLTRSISELRKIFNDNPRQPGVIETIPKVGYRLILSPEIDRRGDSIPGVIPSLNVNPGIEPVTDDSKQLSIFGKWFIAGLFVVALIAGGLWFFLRAPTLTSRSYTTVPLTSFPGFEGRPILSPDGKHVAFSWAGPDGDNTDIYVKLIGTESMLRLTSSPERDFMPAWSPDGTQVAYIKKDGSECTIWMVTAFGGNSRQIGSCGFNIYGDLTWSPDGSLLAFNDRLEGESAYSIYLLSLDTSERTKLTAPPSHMWGDHDPAFSPDGQTISFTRSESEGMQDLFTISVDGSDLNQVTKEHRNINGHDWVDEKHLLFSSNRSGRASLWKIRALGGSPVLIGVPDEYAYFPNISVDRLAYMKGAGETNIWSFSPGVDEAASPIIRSSRWDMHPQFSPDGSQIAFTSNRSGTYEIWVSDSSGRNPMKVTQFNGPFTSTPRWSPEGKSLLFTGRPDGEAHVFTVDLDNLNPQQITKAGADNLAASWSRDGSSIYFSSNRTGSWQVWKQDLATSEEEQITTEGGFGPVESMDSQSVFYTLQDAEGLWELPLDGSEPSLRLNNIDPRDWGSWVVDEQGVYHVHRGQPTFIAYTHFETGQSDTLYVVQKSIPRMDPALSVSSDKSRILFGQVERSESDLVLVEGFEK